MVLPIHPQPLKGESMTSWTVRLANANVTSVHNLLSSCIHERRWDKTDLDLLAENDASVLAGISRIHDEQIPKQMSLSAVRDLLALNGKSIRKSWLSSPFITRYCPLCLGEDRVPYMRLLWRLHFLPICVDHKIFLQNRCWNGACKAVQPLKQFDRDGLCGSCFIQLKDAPISYSKNCDNLLNLSSRVSDILAFKISPRSLGFPLSTKEFFSVLLLLVRYFNEYLPREKEWKEFRQIYCVSPCSFHYRWRIDSSFAALLLEKALVLLERWSAVELFISQNRSSFKKLCYGHANIPGRIRELILSTQNSSKVKP